MSRGRLHSQPMAVGGEQRQALPAGGQRIAVPSPALEHLTGTERGRLVQLERSHVTIGRTVDNDIVLESEAVSRCHARLQLDGGAVRISDNRSKNGVLVNGERVRDRILSDGDIVQLGNFLFRFHGDVRQEGSGSQSGYGFGTPYTTHPHAPQQPFSTTMPGSNVNDPFDATRTAMQIAIAERRSPYFFYGMLAAVGVCGVVLVASRIGGPPTPSVVPTEAQIERKGGASAAVNEIDRNAAKSAALAPIEDDEPEAPHAMPVPAAPEPELPEVEGPTVDQVAAMDDHKAVEIYVREGREFLQRSDFEKAAQAFQIALVIDPRNATAMRGIRAAEFRAKDLESVPLESVPKVVRPRLDPKAKAEAKVEAVRIRNQERGANAQKKVDTLLREARMALEQKKYSEVVRLGEEAREVEVKGDTRHLNEAKQLMDRAKSAQRDEFEPFVEQAKELIGGGRAQSGLELCEEMLRRDPGYGPARECAALARRQMGGKK